jgi:hypothetical protein
MDDNQKIAFEHHKLHLAKQTESFKSVIVFAVEGIKTLQICHGGALTAVLAFAGVRGQSVPAALITSFTCFGVGLTLAVFIWLLAYCAQYSDQKCGEKFTFDWKHPYVLADPKAIVWERIGRLFRLGCLMLAIISAALFAIGIINLRGLFPA